MLNTELQRNWNDVILTKFSSLEILGATNFENVFENFIKMTVLSHCYRVY